MDEDKKKWGIVKNKKINYINTSKVKSEKEISK
jgi:hypothetical protein